MSLASVLFRALIFTVVMPCAVTLYFPLSILRGTAPRLEPPFVLGLVPILVGAAFYLWSTWDFAARGRGTPAPVDPPRALVVHGLYRWVRNPMYVGIVLVLLGEAALYDSRRLLWYTATVAAAMFLFVVLYEEPGLTRRFGDAYVAYRRAVPRFLPRLTPYRPEPR